MRELRVAQSAGFCFGVSRSVDMAEKLLEEHESCACLGELIHNEDVVRRLAVHPNIVGIKEASGNLSYVAKIARYVGPDFALYSGNDDMIVPLLSLGASGVISVLANILPRQTHQMVMDYLEGRPQQALKAQLELLDVINGLFLEVNPIPVKEAMNQMGLPAGVYRQPLAPMGESARQTLTQALRQAGLLEGKV